MYLIRTEEADKLTQMIIDQAQTETIAQDLSRRLRKLEDKDIEAPPPGAHVMRLKDSCLLHLLKYSTSRKFQWQLFFKQKLKASKSVMLVMVLVIS